MRRYETIFITNPDINEQERKSLFDKFIKLIAKENGILVKFDEWGSKKLAYEINKKLHGYYVCITYGGTGELVTELERNFRIDDKILKFMTILLKKNIQPETLHEEITAEISTKDEATSVETQKKEETSISKGEEK